MCADIAPGCNPVPCVTTTCFGTAGSDCITGTAGDDVIFGLGGDDCICAEGGADIVNAGDGADFVFGGDGGDNISGDDGADFLFGEAGNDTLSGGIGDDQLFGDVGDDTLNGGADNDTLSGQGGADILRGDIGDDTLNGGADNDQLFGGDGADSLSGEDGDDVLNGEGGDDPLLDGGAGEDTINGGAGNDTANGGPGLDFINGGPDNDTLSGGDGPDIINGDDGDDVLNGDADNDTLDGGAGANNLLFGNAGIDVCLNAANMDFSCELFTHATLDSLTAFDDGNSVVVRWVTSSETSTAGFYLYREQNGEWVALHEGILPALLDAPQGGVYDFRDAEGDRSEPQQYLLIEVDAHGVQSTHGPFEATANSRGESLLEGDAIYAREAHRLQATQSALKAATSEKQSGGDPVALYFGVEQTGLYAVSAAEIAARFGLDEASVRDRIQTGELSLTEEGETVAWSPSADGSELRFFGLVRKSLYTTERLYRLSFETGTTMTEDSAAPDVITDGLTFEGKLHLEVDQIPGVLVAQDPDQDYWFWQLISAAPAMPESAVVTFDLESVAGDAEMRIDLHGIYDEPHSVDVRINGTLIGTAQFEGVIPHQASFPVPEAALNEGENTLSIEPTTTGDSALYLNFVDLTYTRGYATSAPSLLFGANQDASLEVTGLTGNGIELFDITNPRQPAKLTGAVSSVTGLRLAAETDREYFALTAEEVRAPSSIWNDVPSNLRNQANAADYVLIAPAQLLEKAQELADYREGDELGTMLVELQDIYDEFAFGAPDPNAIRAFLGYAHENWATAPEFVVLIGKGSFDYRDLQGQGGNLLPPIMTLTYGGILSSDTKYADFLGDDGLPDASVGRLPVTSASDLDAVIQQIISYEASIDSLRTDVTLLADADSSQGNFGAASDAVSKALPADWTATAVYRSELGDLESTRALLFDELQKGPRVLSYLGHAGIIALGKAETLFSIEDLETLTIDGHQPVFAAMTCVTSRFAVPGLVSLGEAMLTDDQGAIAVWGPSGISINEQAALLEQELLSELSSGTEARLGPMITRAFGVVVDLEFGRDMIEIYHLFGDPALRVAKADDPPGTGGSGGTAGAGGSGGGSGTGGSSSGNDGLITAGCAVGSSRPDAPGALLLLIGTVALLLRRRNRKRPPANG